MCVSSGLSLWVTGFESLYPMIKPGELGEFQPLIELRRFLGRFPTLKYGDVGEGPLFLRIPILSGNRGRGRGRAGELGL